MFDDTKCLVKTKGLVQGITHNNPQFTSNQASNYVPIDRMLSRDRGEIVKLLDETVSGKLPKR